MSCYSCWRGEVHTQDIYCIAYWYPSKSFSENKNFSYSILVFFIYDVFFYCDVCLSHLFFDENWGWCESSWCILWSVFYLFYKIQLWLSYIFYQFTISFICLFYPGFSNKNHLGNIFNRIFYKHRHLVFFFRIVPHIAL